MSPSISGRRRPAVFLDRDGTLIEDRHYLADPDGVTLLPGAAESIARLRAAGLVTVVVTNQSGIARGYLTPAAYASVAHRLDALLEAAGTKLDATYMCPHHPDVTGPCDCRKPAPGLFVRAATELSLDLPQSVLVGDRWRDIAAAGALGARGILVPSAATPDMDVRDARDHAVIAPTLAGAVEMILRA